MFALLIWVFVTFAFLPFFAAELATSRGDKIIKVWLFIGSYLIFRACIIAMLKMGV